MAWPSTRLPRFADLVLFHILRRGIFLFIQVHVAALHPFFQPERLILQRMRQFMRHHRTLRLRSNPIQQIHGLRFRIVVAGHLLTQQLHQKSLQIEVGWKQPEFFQHQLRPAQALRIFVFGHVFFEISHNFIAGGELALDLMLDRQIRIFAGKFQNLIHLAEDLFRFLGRDFLLLLGLCSAGALARVLFL